MTIVQPQPKLRAALTMLGASVFISLTTFLAKGLGGQFDGGVVGAGASDLHPLQVTAGRFIFGASFWVLFCLVIRQPIGKVHWPIHLTRTLFGWLTVSCLFWASSEMALSDATAISFLNPVFTLALAVIFLGERVGWVRWSAVGVMLVGALVLLRPGTEAFQPVALIALGAAIFGAIEAIFIKRLSNLEPRFQILVVNNLIGLPIAMSAAAFVWVWPSAAQWVLMAVVGLCMAMAQLGFLSSMRGSDASFVVPFMYSTLVYASVLDLVVFGDAPDWLGVVGAAIIVCGAVFMAVREGMMARKGR